MSTKQEIQFPLGQIVATPGALEALRRNHTTGLDFLQRHSRGDWGIVCEEDKQANNEALKSGARLLSAYFLPDETTLWIITDAEDDKGNRAATTMLLPDEY
ncbi:MAG: hypothetical protein IT365_04580 [Candidatus Hydrogenedentes bacterium]|nr:hypothetical protein [Candidatus Hydrogenedentota bacterium]